MRNLSLHRNLFMRATPRLLVLGAVLVLASSTEAKTWRVNIEGTGDAPTIQAALDSSQTGDLILVEPGTYYEHLDFLGKNVWLKSTAGNAVTKLDGEDTPGSIVKFSNGESRSAVLDGFTLTKGTGEPITPDGRNWAGGAILLSKSASPTIRNNVFFRNRTGGERGFGGAISLTDHDFPQETHPNPLIESNLFLENESTTNGGAIALTAGVILNNVFVQNTTGPGDGGAIWAVSIWDGAYTIQGNQFWENEAEDHGGAIEISVVVESSIENNLFVRNIAHGSDPPANIGAGGAIGCRPMTGTIGHNTFYANVATGGACRAGAILFDGSQNTATVENNIFSNNEGCGIVCLETGEPIVVRRNLFWENGQEHLVDEMFGLDCFILEDNVFENPLFCSPEADNFTVGEDSPALTSGSPIGAFWNPGCGAGVPVQETTWGKIKALYHQEP